MLCSSSLVLCLLPLAALGSVFVQYNSASDTSLAMRVVTDGTCKDVYATTRIYVDSQFMFREVPALGNSSGVSLVPAPNPGYFICSDGTDSGRLIVCSFKKVAGLSNPSLVSFEQRGRYIGYAKAFDYDCASFYRGNTAGWTVGLVDKPANPNLATWITSEAGPVRIYIQSTQSWLGNCHGNSFFTEQTGDTVWDLVPALSNSSSSTMLVSLQLHNTSLHLGVDTDQNQLMDNSSAAHVPLTVANCSGRESLCTWFIVPSALHGGNFHLEIAGTGRAVYLQSLGSTLSCATASRGTASISLAAGAELGFLRRDFASPPRPAVIVNESSSSEEPAKCSDIKQCRTCIVTSMSCGCVKAGGSSTNLVAPLVGGIVGGVAVLSSVVIAAVLVARSIHNKRRTALNMPVEGASVNFAAASQDIGDTVSPLATLGLSGSSPGVIATLGTNGRSGVLTSGMLMTLPVGLPSVADLNLASAVSSGRNALEMPQPLRGLCLGSNGSSLAVAGSSAGSSTLSSMQPAVAPHMM
eukprot:m51a1_g11658 hypothetical protein (524) ;mRNA; r:3333-5260